MENNNLCIAVLRTFEISIAVGKVSLKEDDQDSVMKNKRSPVDHSLQNPESDRRLSWKMLLSFPVEKALNR